MLLTAILNLLLLPCNSRLFSSSCVLYIVAISSYENHTITLPSLRFHLEILSSFKHQLCATFVHLRTPATYSFCSFSVPHSSIILANLLPRTPAAYCTFPCPRFAVFSSSFCSHPSLPEVRTLLSSSYCLKPASKPLRFSSVIFAVPVVRSLFQQTFQVRYVPLNYCKWAYCFKIIICVKTDQRICIIYF